MKRYTSQLWSLLIGVAAIFSYFSTIIISVLADKLLMFLQVPFGKVIRCPSCMIAVTVAQPQHGIQASFLVCSISFS